MIRRIVVLGTRGIPDILGGVETHCQELYPRLVKEGWDITICRRSCYVSDSLNEYQRICLKDIYAPKIKSFEAIVHSFLCVCYAKRIGADVVHIHAVGNALVAPFAKILGLKVVITHHGADYERQKWGRMAKFMLRLGEKMGIRYADRVIVISNHIKQDIEKKYRRSDCAVIYNGISAPCKPDKTDYLDKIGVKPQRYILMMGRFVEEKGFHDAVEAFGKLSTNYALVLAGDADHETAYSLHLKKLCRTNRAVLTGFIKGEPLNQLLTNARLFLMPSYHEGLPFALLEAMSYGLPIVASDISANKQVNLPSEYYYSVGNVEELRSKIDLALRSSDRSVKYDLSAYDWTMIARQTKDVFDSLR